MKDGHVGGRNDTFSQRCIRKTTSEENHISTLKDIIERPFSLLHVSKRKTAEY